MNDSKRNAMAAFGLIAALQLATAQAQSEHDGHRPNGAPSTQTSTQADHPSQPHGGMMNHPGMDHDTMMQMHEQHMGSDHRSMSKGQMRHDEPEGTDQNPQRDH